MIKVSYTTCARESNRAINILRTKALWVYYMLGRPKYLESRWRFIVKLLKNFKLYLRTKIVGVLPWKIFYKWKRQNIDAWIKACINLANIFIKYLNTSATNLDALSQANWMLDAWPNKEFVATQLKPEVIHKSRTPPPVPLSRVCEHSSTSGSVNISRERSIKISTTKKKLGWRFLSTLGHPVWLSLRRSLIACSTSLPVRSRLALYRLSADRIPENPRLPSRMPAAALPVANRSN